MSTCEGPRGFAAVVGLGLRELSEATARRAGPRLPGGGPAAATVKAEKTHVGTMAPSPLQDRILDAVSDGPLTQKQLQERIGCARRSLYDALRTLVAMGLVERKPDFRDLRQSVFVPRRG